MNYSDKTVSELKEICKERNITGISGKKKQEIVELIQKQEALKTQAKQSLGTNANNITVNIFEVESDIPRTKDEPEVPLDKGGNYWYQKNKTDVPEYVKILEIHKDGNNYYYTIQMRDKSEKQTIRQYLFYWKTPPLYSLLPDDNRERLQRVYDYGVIKGQILQQTKSIPKESNREWRFEDIVPRDKDDRKRLNCVYNQALHDARVKMVRQFWIDDDNRRSTTQDCNPS
jgi:hypothetical protein